MAQKTRTLHVSEETHTRIKKRRDDAAKTNPKATLGAEVAKLLDSEIAKKKTPEAAAVGAGTGIDLGSRFLTKPRRWFRPNEADGAGMEKLGENEYAGADLIKTAAQVLGAPMDNFIQFATLQFAKQTLLEHYRAKAGSIATNAAGRANEKLAEVFKTMHASGVPVTPTRLRDRAGTNNIAAERWLLLFHPECL